MDHFGLKGCKKVFMLSSSVFSSVTHLCVILCLHISSLTLCALYLLFVVYVYALKSSSSLLHFIYSYSTLS